MCIPISVICFGIYTCRRLVQAGEFSFNKFETKGLGAAYRDARSSHSCRGGMMSLFISLHDMRFKGDWAKKSDEAKTFGFFLANTAGLWFCFAIPLLKKIACALCANVALPTINATLMTAIYWTDVVCSVYFRGHRDGVVNFSGALVALGNGCSVLLAALPMLLPPEWLPSWISGPYVIMLTSAMTAISALVALIGPISDALSGSARAIAVALKYGGCLAMLRPVTALVNALRVSMVARFQRIFLTRCVRV